MKIDINALNNWQQQVFAAALLQRMLPNYAYFSEASQFGDYNLLNNQADIIWQKLSLLPIKFNLEAQLEKLHANIPNETNYDFFAVYPAIDVCSGLVSLFESFDEKETRCGLDLSLLSLNSVNSYVRLEIEEENDEVEEEQLNKLVENHPLFKWELETQNELFELVRSLTPSKQNAHKAKIEAQKERLSNLAIEY